MLVVKWVVRDDDFGAVAVDASDAVGAALQALAVRDCAVPNKYTRFDNKTTLAT